MIRSTWKAVLLLVVTFLAGVAVGGLASTGWGRHHWMRSHERGPDAYLRLLDRELDLSVAQRDSVRVILARHQGEMDSIWVAMEPRFETLRQAIRSEVRAQLSPDQQRKYSELTERYDAHWRRLRDARTGHDTTR